MTSGAKKFIGTTKKIIHSNNSVKQQTIYEITTNTTCISNKRNQQTILKKLQNFYSKKK
jgi:hypothetical protein